MVTIIINSTTRIESLQGNNHLMHVYTGIMGTVQPGLLGLHGFQDMEVHDLELVHLILE